MKKVMIYTDGACSGNPGIGGYAAIMFYNGHEKVISGGIRDTTNNRMELFAIVESLRQLKEGCDVEIYSDSAYCVNAIANGWLENWQKNGWKNSSKEPVKNKDLWIDYLLSAKEHKINFVKVEGHSGDEYNERCDKIAKNEIALITKSTSKRFA